MLQYISQVISCGRIAVLGRWKQMKKVLVLEDEDSIRSFVVINLRRAGFEPVEAACGQAALDALEADPEICRR